MKTKLPIKIATLEEAKAFLTELVKNHEDFHPEDDATDIVEWASIDDDTEPPTLEEAQQLNKLMEDIYDLPENDGSHNDTIKFCPARFIMWLYMPKEFSAREAATKLFYDNFDLTKIEGRLYYIKGWKYKRGFFYYTKSPFEENNL